tara:strand:- start:12557 stop:13912 length:1356 start_codon:yes stop_codon:yes gene_type:complete
MLAVAILAAGKGTRMVSSLPKVLHKLSGKTLLERVLQSCHNLNPSKIFIIVGHKADEVKKTLEISLFNENVHFILQEPQNGTGHAVQVLSKELIDFKGKLLVLNGDVPLIKSKTLKELIKVHDMNKADASLITTVKDNPYGYGRVFIKRKNLIEKIVEEKDCDPEERLNRLINSGIYCFNWQSLYKNINFIQNNNSQKEIYLTDVISMVNKSFSYEIESDDELQGVNNRVDLAKCEKIIQKQIIETHMLNGVTFRNPESCSISEECEIGMDVVIEANSHVRGKSKIANNCIIGPNTFIEDSKVNIACKILNSSIFNSKIMSNVSIGPYSHIRPETEISSNCKVGNFVEIKNSFIDESVKINHLSYIGDTNIGKNTNVGAGTITANFNGLKKNKTVIGEDCSIGANTVLVAPVSLDNSVTTGAGSVINKDVEDNSLAISRTKQVNINNWKKK